MLISDPNGSLRDAPGHQFGVIFADVLAAQGPAGAPETEKDDFWCIRVVLRSAFGLLWAYFQYTFCRYEVVWVSCLQRSFPRDVTGHSIIF